ncbi:PTS sugar transporter subunit IIC [Salibacterium lacus]|uniref:Permease IIC component n=1 Tax=Salibacterium lacus TaxID=1898109 RepID=A0ABW5T4L9_9BACI
MAFQNIQSRLQQTAGKISGNLYLKAISNGLLSTLPALIIGAFSTLLSSLAFEPYQNFISATGLGTVLELPSIYTINIISLYAVFFIAYRLTESFDVDGLPAGLIALISFLLLTPSTMMDETRFLPFEFLGAQGLFVAIIVGLVSARLYILITNKNIGIKMPEGVPPTVGKTFFSLVPAILIVSLFTLISTAFSNTNFESAHNFVYSFIQSPLQDLGGGFWSLIIMTLLVQVLWLLGIHGMLVILPIYYSVWLPLGVENLEALQAGEQLPNIVNTGFFTAFVIVGGSGVTLGLCILMSFIAKSSRYKTLGRLALPGSFFGINEPLIFGLPIVLNPYLAIPFIAAPLFGACAAYFSMASGLVPYVAGTHLPLGTPVIASAFLQGGIILVILQIIIIFVGTLIYYPFFRYLDNQALKEEQQSES